MSNKCFFCKTEISSNKRFQSPVPSDNKQGWVWVDGCQECVRKNYALEELRHIRTGTGETLYWNAQTKRNTTTIKR
ncbi:MAG TPA: hypothetical protein ENI23_04070 [bacterium]|nr:hypothetical protein [bacterium]